jgi:hypothetical protein
MRNDVLQRIIDNPDFRDKVIARVMKFIHIKQAGSTCWIFNGNLIHGYPYMRIDGILLNVTRLMYVCEHRKLTDQNIKHSCENTQCVNPDHLVKS